MDEKYYDITKEYPSMFRIVVYKQPLKLDALKKPKNKTTATISDDSTEKSIRRTRSVLRDYIYCNDFDLFVTFTLDPKKIDRYNMMACYLKMQSWLRRQYIKSKDQGKNLQYIIVPEQHKDGAIHFHALISGYEFSTKKTNVIQNNRRVYNIPMFKFGFTNAQVLDTKDKLKALNYIAKYLTKDMILTPNKRRYWSSRNLTKPVKFYNRIYELNLWHKLNPLSIVSESEYNVVYEVPKDLFI